MSTKCSTNVPLCAAYSEIHNEPFNLESTVLQLKNGRRIIESAGPVLAPSQIRSGIRLFPDDGAATIRDF